MDMKGLALCVVAWTVRESPMVKAGQGEDGQGGGLGDRGQAWQPLEAG